MENFYTNNNPENVEWVDEEITIQENDLDLVDGPIFPAIEEVSAVVDEPKIYEDVVLATPQDDSQVTIYALRDSNVLGATKIKQGYNDISKSDYEKIKHIKTIRLARPDELSKRRKK